MPTEIVSLLITLAAAIGVFAIAFLLVPFLQVKFPAAWAKIANILKRRDVMQFIYQAMVRVWIPEIDKVKIDTLFDMILYYVTKAEELFNAGTLPAEDRKAFVLKMVQELMTEWEVTITPAAETVISYAIEAAVSILQLRHGPAGRSLNA